jgi:hypothetical protein
MGSGGIGGEEDCEEARVEPLGRFIRKVARGVLTGTPKPSGMVGSQAKYLRRNCLERRWRWAMERVDGCGLAMESKRPDGADP